MPFAVELALDGVPGACVRRLWNELAEAGVTSMGVRALHATSHRRFAPFGTEAWADDAPRAWTPHRTLAAHVTDKLATAALAIARRVPLPLDGRLERVGIVAFRPVKQLCAFDLGGGASATPAP